MSRVPEFHWDKDNGEAVCILIDEKKRRFVGTAYCHEDDRDMMSERTGCEIAYRRARIEQICAIRDCDIKPALAALKQLYFSMKHSKNFNPKSYENKMLQRHIRSLEFDLTTIKEMLAYEREELKDYIADKDKFYQKARSIKKARSN